MAPETAGRTGVLIARAWEEPRGGLRIRVTYRRDVLHSVETSVSATSVEEVCAQVERWLAMVRRT